MPFALNYDGSHVRALPHGSLKYSTSGEEKHLRRRLVLADLLEYSETGSE